MRPRPLSSSRKPASGVLGGRSTRLTRRRLLAFRVDPKDLRWCCDPRTLPFKTTADLPQGQKIIGQDKAMRGLSLGIHMESPGYNLFVCGFPGTGRRTAIKTVLSNYRRKGYQPVDLCYAPNFTAPERPRLLSFPAGQGGRFRHDVESFLGRARRAGRVVAPPRRRRLLRDVVDLHQRELLLSYPGPTV